jgi:hypothetical protein
MKTEFEDYVVTDRPHPQGQGGFQKVFKFDNGFGGSLIQGGISYGKDQGLYELAVVKFDNENWSLTYDTPVTDDVLGWLSESDVNEKLGEIKALL